jgi:hypothetical protein
VQSAGGHNSAAAKTAMRNVVDGLPGSSVRLGRIFTGDFWLILIIKASANYAAVFYFGYPGTVTSKGLIESMSKCNGTWGDLIAISS